MPVAAAIKLHE